VTESQTFRRFAQVAQKWRNLVELRCAYFIALQKTGRWKWYYSEAKFLDVMREAVALAETWSAIAPRLEDEGFAPSAKADPGPRPPRRTAA
jgi:uncharacterized repeat protein (TIGR03809 family)